jgi:hypothetical protein
MISRDAWLAALGGAQTCDPDALTVRELAELRGTSMRRMRERLATLEADGTVQRTMKRLIRRDGTHTLVVAYRLITP